MFYTVGFYTVGFKLWGFTQWDLHCGVYTVESFIQRVYTVGFYTRGFTLWGLHCGEFYTVGFTLWSLQNSLHSGVYSRVLHNGVYTVEGFTQGDLHSGVYTGVCTVGFTQWDLHCGVCTVGFTAGPEQGSSTPGAAAPGDTLHSRARDNSNTGPSLPKGLQYSAGTQLWFYPCYLGNSFTILTTSAEQIQTESLKK